MYEIVFDESLGGGMKMARCRQKSCSGDKVIELSFDLDRGPIRDGILNPEKKKLFIEKYDGSRFPDHNAHEQQEAAWNYLQRELDRLHELAAKGETFRIWYSDLPYSLCGLYFVCHALRRAGCSVYTVKLPDMVVKGETAVQYRDWHEVSADELLDFTDRQRLLGPAEIRSYAVAWEELAEQDGPLRVTLNGKVSTVGEDFYDSILERNMPQGIFSTWTWISKVWDLAGGAHEEVLLSRIEALIDAGTAEIAEEGEDSVWSRRMKRPEEQIEIRQVKTEEYRRTEELIREAFWNHYVPGCSEHYVAHQLRQSAGFIPELDLVLVRNGHPAGSIMCSHAKIVCRDGREIPAICFGPLAVLPEDQQSGMGEALMREAMKRAGDLGYRLAVILGDPQYYERFGFRYAENYDTGISDETFADSLLMAELSGGEIPVLDGGVFVYDAAFEADPAEVEAFDRGFSSKEKISGLPSQMVFQAMAERTRPRNEPRRRGREVYRIAAAEEAEIY